MIQQQQRGEEGGRPIKRRPFGGSAGAGAHTRRLETVELVLTFCSIGGCNIDGK